jgi:hypothetical protein
VAKHEDSSRGAARPSELERLDSFAGVWRTDGEMNVGPSGQPVTFTAKDVYEWLPGGYFLLHRFDADMPEGRLQGMEVIGYSPEDDFYPMRSFDSLGNESVMKARWDEDTWTFAGENVRFTGRFHDDGNVFAGLWEQRAADGAPWQAWMNVKLTKTG